MTRGEELTDEQWLILEPLLPELPRRRSDRPFRMLHRRHVHRGEKRGTAVGPTQRGKGTKLMAVASPFGLPLAVHATSSSPAGVTLVRATSETRFIPERPEHLICDKAYDIDPLDASLAE